MFRSFAVIAVSSVALLLASCQPEPPVSTRAAVDALDKATADARKARIANIEYEVQVDIATSEVALVGEVSIQFDLSDAASDLTVDFTGGELSSVVVNGVASTADYNGYYITLPAGQLQLGANTVEIAYRHPFGNDGNGLHRFVDPEDGLTYLYTYLWPYYANRLLPSFDQPNLKANFSLRVLAPENWTVVSMSPGSAEPAADNNQLWTFTKTPKIATYMFSLHAGPYAVWTDDSGKVPLRLFARQSLAEYVPVDEWFDITKKGMAFYSEYFDIPYPFEKYDQLIVPEFNIGGMENAAAVTYTENIVQTQPSNRTERQRRASLLLHEQAHMWFGDLVTHDWWNGMWLNESFATQMSTLAQIETTEFQDQWHGYFAFSKQEAYQRDSRVTTHPIEMPVASSDQFTELFDAITYQKGGSALKQLQHKVGAENYRLGVSTYLKEHSFGTTELSDFIEHQSKSGDIDLSGWSDDWLMTTDFNTLAVETECEDDTLRSLTIVQSASGESPVLRSHEVEVALYDSNAAGALVVTHAIPVSVAGERTSVDLVAELACPMLVNPNYSDWTFARIAISDDDVSALGEYLAAIEDPLSRSMFLVALFDRAMAGDTAITSYIEQALTLAETETNMTVLQQITASLADSVSILQRLRPEADSVLPGVLKQIEGFSLMKAEFAETQDLKSLWLNTFLSVVSSEAGIGTARALLDGEAEISGVEISSEIRWQLLIILSRHNADDVEELLQAEIERDSSDYGQRQLLSARAAAPDLVNKTFWVQELQSPDLLTSLGKQRAVMSALFPATQTALQLELLPQLLSALPRMSREADPYFLTSYTGLLTPMCRAKSSALMQATLDEFGAQLNPTALRFLREAHQMDAECQSLRSSQSP